MKERVRFARGKRPANTPAKVRVQRNKPNRLPCKQTIHIRFSTRGYLAPSIYAVPDSKMLKEDIDHSKVDGLGVGTDLKTTGTWGLRRAAATRIDYFGGLLRRGSVFCAADPPNISY